MGTEIEEKQFEAAVQDQQQQIEADREALAAAKSAADAALVARIAERDSVQADRRRKIGTFNLANTKLSELHRQIKTAVPTTVLTVFDSHEGDQLSFKPMEGLKKLFGERSTIELFIEEARYFLLESEELEMNAEREVLLAEAEQIDALIAQRRYEMSLALTPLTALEGQILVDTSKTVSGELERKSAEIKLQAAGMLDRIAEAQKRLKTFR